MTTELKHITYVATRVATSEAVEISERLSKDVSAIIRGVESVQEIFPLLSNPDYIVDFVAIDIDDLYEVNGADVFDVLKTLSTLIHCTVYRETKRTRPQKRTTKIVVIVSEDTDPKMLKEILSLQEVNYLSLRYGPNQSVSVVFRAGTWWII